MMTGKNVMNSGIEQKINQAMEGMQKELQQKSWSRLEKFSKPESIKIYEEHLFSALNSMENEKLEELIAEMDQYVNFFIMGFFTKDMFTDIDVILPYRIRRKLMKTYQSSAICPKCGKLLRTNNAKSYNFYCNNCSGRFRSNSIKDSDDELFRISIPATADEYEVHNEQLLEITEKYHCDFLGYDDGCGLIDIGWEKAYPDYTTMHAFLAEVNQVFS